MRKWIEKILPGYSVLPLILAVSINMLVYFGTSQLRDYLTFHTITTALDEWIPFVAPFILFYVLAYIQWIANYLLVVREGKEFCYRIVYGDVAAKVICLLFFLFFPTTLARPEVTGSGFCNDLVRFIYRMDAPVNLFPSIHCLESWCCIHAAFAMKKPPKWYRYATTVMALGVFASTLFVKQHVLVDVFGGIIVYEIGYYIAGRTITFLNKKKELQKE